MQTKSMAINDVVMSWFLQTYRIPPAHGTTVQLVLSKHLGESQYKKSPYEIRAQLALWY